MLDSNLIIRNRTGQNEWHTILDIYDLLEGFIA
jgi:hypothetical protein